MRIKPAHLITLTLLGVSVLALAKGKYDSEKICQEINPVSECDHLVEKTVSKDVPGIIERKGQALKIHAKSGKTVERTNSNASGEGHKEMWVCDYFPKYGYVRVCYRFWESSGTEFVNIHSGSSNFVAGWPIYSPSGQRILMVNGYGGAVYSLEIWRFEEQKLFKEFHSESPPGPGWETAAWKSENEIEPNQSSLPRGPRYILLRKAGSWEIHAK